MKRSNLMVPLTIAGALIVPVVLLAQLPMPPGPAVDPTMQFEAASIKPFDASSGGSRIMMTPGRFEAVGVPARMLLRQALRVQDYQIIGIPGWADTERYAIVAKAPDGTPPNATPVMLMNLLKDRFKLATRTETRELPIFNLVLARDDGRLGPNLKPTSPECAAQIAARAGGAGRGRGEPGRAGGPGGPGGPAPGRGGPPPFDLNAPMACGNMRMSPGLSNASGVPIAQLVQLLAQFTGRPVYDKTGLAGPHDFDLKWSPEPGMAGPLGPAPPGAPVPQVDPDAPNLYTAVQEQLGLKLENARGPVEVTIIDRIERPELD